MSLNSALSFPNKPRILVLTWALASLLAVYLSENLWVDAWAGGKFAGMPTLAPEPLSSMWYVVFAAGGISCVVLVVCQILVSLHRRIPLRSKIGTGIAVVGACVLWGVWFNAARGTPAGAPAQQSKRHTVKLNWKGSIAPVVGYNVYRSLAKGQGYVKINAGLVQGLAYTDDGVEAGRTYYYVTRSVDGGGRESGNSAEVVAVVP